MFFQKCQEKCTFISSLVSDGLRKYVWNIYIILMDWLNVTELLPENLKQSRIMAIFIPKMELSDQDFNKNSL